MHIEIEHSVDSSESSPSLYPVQFQADNINADDASVMCMCHVFDRDGVITMREALQNRYLHVIAWDATGCKVFEYDNR